VFAIKNPEKYYAENQIHTSISNSPTLPLSCNLHSENICSRKGYHNFFSSTYDKKYDADRRDAYIFSKAAAKKAKLVPVIVFRIINDYHLWFVVFFSKKHKSNYKNTIIKLLFFLFLSLLSRLWCAKDLKTRTLFAHHWCDTVFKLMLLLLLVLKRGKHPNGKKVAALSTLRLTTRDAAAKVSWFL